MFIIMKKVVLLVSIVLASNAGFGQLTQANEPAVGSNSTMYFVDTTGLGDMSGVTGTNVEWDYTGQMMSLSPTQDIGVSDPSSTTYAYNYPTSTKAASQGTIVQFYNSTATERMSQGFVFNEPNLGEVIVTLDVDEAQVMTYPFAYGSTSTDHYEGTATLSLGSGDVVGDVYSEIDGTGTLKLPNMDLPNVFRLKTIDTSLVTMQFTTAEVYRTQYEYYDLTVQNLPIFLDVTIEIPGFGTQRQVLSKNYSTLGIKDNTISDVVVYPNPSNGKFSVLGSFTKGLVEVFDMAGKKVYDSEITAGTLVKLNDVKSGVYTVKVSQNDSMSIHKITIK